MTRILITGSRHWTDEDRIREALLAHGPGVVVHGGAHGADLLADSIARALGWEVDPNPADWAQFKKRAGRLRNQTMVDKGADVCLAFPMKDSVGTYDCVARARRAGITVLLHPAAGLTEAEMCRAIDRATSRLEPLAVDPARTFTFRRPR